MEIQLQELLDQIKKDGVEAAQAEAEAIISRAKAEAEQIVSQAREDAQRSMLDARAENERLVRSSEQAIIQAGRNLLLSFRESVTHELEAIVGENVCEVYSGESLCSLIACACEAFSKKAEAENITVLLNQRDLELLKDSALCELKKRMLSGVTLSPCDSFVGGFRISAEGSNIYYDYSSDAVVDMLCEYLSPKLTAIMKEAEQA